MRAGIVNELLLLEREKVTPALGAADVRVTVQVVLPAPVIDVLAHFPADNVEVCIAAPLPCSFTVPEYLACEVILVAMTLSWPLESVVTLGSKRTCATTLWPA